MYINLYAINLLTNLEYFDAAEMENYIVFFLLHLQFFYVVPLATVIVRPS